MTRIPCEKKMLFTRVILLDQHQSYPEKGVINNEK